MTRLLIMFFYGAASAADGSKKPFDRAAGGVAFVGALLFLFALLLGIVAWLTR